MTLTLILTRHAKSGWDDPALDDHDRPLNARGQADAPRIGGWLRSKGYLPDRALVSSARRTQETWERLSPELGRPVPMTVVPALYHAEAGEILGQLRRAEGRTVMVIGHNPGIGEFAHRIVEDPAEHPRFLDYPTCATLVAEFPGETWGDVDWWSGRVVDFVVPRDL
ncbi:SixA phosphatase family protein [Roseicyclus persicicus]|uniref:Histidine phosphatase family protein n=1 Tax=Roseicyclus persicicus TaxID=2650661 RepID=A0A7X6GZT3_9RHOB|nr:histidine phosphatase family protein [Roseibacterium persicicum]NKX45376.1 histidine phosphatase family protein [Roseibacterium persicicum]